MDGWDALDHILQICTRETWGTSGQDRGIRI
jgi:hypothetical protein